MRLTPLVPLAVGLTLLVTPALAQDIHGGNQSVAGEAADAPPGNPGQIPTEEMTVLDGAFTQAQADRGKVVYDTSCASCHGGNLRGTWNMGPSIAGFRFERSWVGLTVAELYGFVQAAMPKEEPGSLTDAQYADVVAYILLRNDYPVGDTVDIPVDPDAQALISIIAQE